MDDADRAELEEQNARDMAIAQARSAPALRPRGRCHYCEEDITSPLLFCNCECAQDFEREDEQLKKMGRR